MLLGFSIAAPVGPIGLLCIRTTLERGRLAGLASGLGAAAADGCYGLLAALGFALVAERLVPHAALLRVGGGLVLAAIGVDALRSRPPEGGGGREPAARIGRAFVLTFLLTLGNPLTMLSFLAMFGAVGVSAGGSALALVLGVVAGSAAWWLLLSSGVALLRDRLRPERLRAINLAAGGLIAAAGVVLVVGGVVAMLR